MDWTPLVIATGTISTAIGALGGVVAKAYSDNRSGERKQYTDQLQLALAQQAKLEAKLDIQGGYIANLKQRVEDLLVANTTLAAENRQFRRDIDVLQRQVRSLGHEPSVLDIEETHS